MSLKCEQYQSLVKTRKFLRDLLNEEIKIKNKKEIAERITECLKHFPFLDKYGEPIFSQDSFPCPEINKTVEESED